MIETDYPHSDTTWPDCIGVAQKLLDRPARRRRSTRSCAATPSGCTASRRPTPPVRGECLTATPSIEVDRELCIGSGMCIVYAPGTFAHDDETKAVVVDPAGDPIDAIRKRCEACPTRRSAW